MATIAIPPLLARPHGDEPPAYRDWLAGLPEAVEALASDWALRLGEPYLPGGYCAWVAPARTAAEQQVVLKVGWRGHWEGEHEAEGLRAWDGDGAVRCLAARTVGDATALLLERCAPGTPLGSALPEAEQDIVVAGLLRRLWSHRPPDDHPFRSLQYMCGRWADSVEGHLPPRRDGFDPGLAREGIALLRELPASAERSVLLSTDLHAGNVLASEREPWLAIDPKPFVGDPAYDPVQHMLNCDQRRRDDPVGLSRRMASLLDLDAERVRLWLFARCAQESLTDDAMCEPARRLAP